MSRCPTDEGITDRRLTCVLLVVHGIVVRSLEVLDGCHHNLVRDFGYELFTKLSLLCSQVRCLFMVEAAQATYANTADQLVRTAVSEAHSRVCLTRGYWKADRKVPKSSASPGCSGAPSSSLNCSSAPIRIFEWEPRRVLPVCLREARLEIAGVRMKEGVTLSNTSRRGHLTPRMNAGRKTSPFSSRETSFHISCPQRRRSRTEVKNPAQFRDCP